MKKLLLMFMALMFLVVVPCLWASGEKSSYSDGDLDAVLADKSDSMGLSVLPLQKLKMIAFLKTSPTTCETTALVKALELSGEAVKVAEKEPITKCIGVTTLGGNSAALYVWDSVAAGLTAQDLMGKELILYCDYFFVSVDGPGILVNSFEPAKK